MKTDELCHWGIKGQKWGRRRYQNKDGSLTPEGKKRYGTNDSITESKKDYSPKKKKTSEMTDEELAKEVTRLAREKQYKNLMAELYPEQRNKALDFVKSVAISAGKDVATNLIKKILNDAANKAYASVTKKR